MRIVTVRSRLGVEGTEWASLRMLSTQVLVAIDAGKVANVGRDEVGECLSHCHAS